LVGSYNILAVDMLLDAYLLKEEITAKENALLKEHAAHEEVCHTEHTPFVNGSRVSPSTVCEGLHATWVFDVPDLVGQPAL